MLAGGYDSPVVDTGAYSYPRVCYLGYKIYPRVIHRAILDTGLSYSPMYTLCTGVKSYCTDDTVEQIRLKRSSGSATAPHLIES